MLTTSALSVASGLSPAELGRFYENGWVGPFPLLDTAGVEALATTGLESQKYFRYSQNLSDVDFEGCHWFKSLHAHYVDFYDAAAHCAVVSRLRTILGDDILAWGVSMTMRRPAQRHRWHVDIEHARWDGITVFIGLKNTMSGSSLTVISGSHRVNGLPQFSNIQSDLEALNACRSVEPGSELHTVDMNEGEFFIFHGRLWHSSLNKTDATRSSIVAQYSRPDAVFAIPLTYDEPVVWSKHRPLCVLVSEHDRYAVNQVVSKPLTNFQPRLSMPVDEG
jgi:hypothetical protein